MKILLRESQLEGLIMKQFDNLFSDDVSWYHPYEFNDETGEEYEDPTRMEFYFGNYGDEKTFFRWYDKDYWGGTFSSSFRNYKQNSPLIEIETTYSNTLNNLFGDKWYEPFKKWVQMRFNIPVKKIIDELYN